jgi:hypothetical protein
MSVSITGCGEKEKIVGTWIWNEDDKILEYNFLSDGTLTVFDTDSQNKIGGTYSIKQKKLEIIFDDGNIMSCEFKVKNETLTLIYESISAILTKK